jgi:hypothetical protein
MEIMWRSDIFLKDVSAYCNSSKGLEYKLNDPCIFNI